MPSSLVWATYCVELLKGRSIIRNSSGCQTCLPSGVGRDVGATLASTRRDSIYIRNSGTRVLVDCSTYLGFFLVIHQQATGASIHDQVGCGRVG